MDETMRQNYDGVVVGWDLSYDFRKICKAACILNGGAKTSNSSEARGKVKPAFFYATNDDAFDIVNGHCLPATGALLKPIELVTEKFGDLDPSKNRTSKLKAKSASDTESPYGSKAVVLGKPNPEFLLSVVRERKLDPKKCVLIGDRLDTDILMGKRAGIDTVLVLTGVHSEADVGKLGIQLTHILRSLADVNADGLVKLETHNLDQKVSDSTQSKL